MGFVRRVANRLTAPSKALTLPAPAPRLAPGKKALSGLDSLTLSGLAWGNYGRGAGSIDITDTAFASYAQLYTRQTWVRVVADKLAVGVGRVPPKVYRRNRDGTRERLGPRDHPLAALLANPYPDGSTFGLIEQIAGDVALYNNSLLVLLKTSRTAEPTGIEPFTPVGWRVDDDDRSYVLSAPGEPDKRIPRWRIAHAKFYTPGGGAFAVSKLESLRQTLRIEYAAQLLADASYHNAARPSGALVAKEELSDVAYARMQAQFRESYQGVENAYEPLLLEGGLTWHPMSSSLIESAAIDHRKLTREEVAAVYQLPPPVIGILDRASFNNIEELHLALYRDTISPWLKMIEQTIQVQIVDKVPAWVAEGIYVEFDLNEVLRGNVKDRFAAYQSAIQSGWLTQNEVRALENRDRHDDPDADRLHRPMNLTPDLTAPKPAPAPPGAPAVEETEEPAKVGGVRAAR